MPIGDWVAALLGGQQPLQSPTVEPAPTPQSYPSTEDANYARKYGFGYGDHNVDGYVQGNSARVYGTNFRSPKDPSHAIFIPLSGTGSTLQELTPKVGDNISRNVAPAPDPLKDVYTRAALAANRIPIAALGFDPGHMVADVITKNANIAGAQSPTNDSIYFNLTGNAPATPVHESIHRGMTMLRSDPRSKAMMQYLPDEESVVRYLMATQAGDPEKGEGDVGDRQRSFALGMFNGPMGQDYKNSLDKLSGLAQQMIYERNPRGPR